MDQRRKNKWNYVIFATATTPLQPLQQKTRLVQPKVSPERKIMVQVMTPSVINIGHHKAHEHQPQSPKIQRHVLSYGACNYIFVHVKITSESFILK
jgi:hypothetical protein